MDLIVYMTANVKMAHIAIKKMVVACALLDFLSVFCFKLFWFILKSIEIMMQMRKVKIYNTKFSSFQI